MNWVVVPKWIKRLFSKCIWEIKTTDKKIYITFDDGPTPEVTPQVLALLQKYNAKATFFCLGENIEKYPEIVNQIIANGHIIANHGYKHLDGFSVSKQRFFENMELGAKLSKSNLFRPPYGHVFPWYLKGIQKNNKIVIWSILAFDFDKTKTSNDCFINITKNIFPGAIIVLHDTKKASERLLPLLPNFLEWLQKNKYQMCSLERESISFS